MKKKELFINLKPNSPVIIRKNDFSNTTEKTDTGMRYLWIFGLACTTTTVDMI